MKWSYVEAVSGDWCALYENGSLKWQGHRSDLEWSWWLLQSLPTEFEDLGRVEIQDRFPKELKDLER